MKYLFVFFAPWKNTFSQNNYAPLDSARKSVLLHKSPDNRFRDMRRLDRYYYTTGLYDSSALVEKELYALARDLKKSEEAKQIALESLLVAIKTGITEGISTVAERLRKTYTQSNQKDSIIYYSQLQIDYKDSVSNQKKVSEFQNITFAQQLRQIDEETKSKQATEERKQNIQYALIALGITTFIIPYLLLSRSFITDEKLITFFWVVALLIVFEFLNLLLHPFLERVTNHSPVLMVLALVCIAALLVPFHHRVEKWATAKLVEKNKQIRLATAKKTVAKLEKNKNV